MDDSFDPLAFFPSEKVAGAGGRINAKDPDPKSDDPGERALAGLVASVGGAAGKVGQFLGNVALRTVVGEGETKWPQTGFGSGVDNVSRIGDMMKGDFRTPASTRVFDSIPITERLRHGTKELSPKQFSEYQELIAPEMMKKLDDSKELVDSFIDKHNLAGKGVTMSFRRGPMGQGMKYHFGDKTVRMNSINPEMMLHELGHAADYTGSRTGKARALLEAPVRKGVQIALPIAFAAGDEIRDMLPGTIDDKAIRFMQDNAPEIMGATLAATNLYPEAKANAMALKHIADTQGRGAAQAAAKKFGASFGTHVMGAIPAIVGMSLARKYMREARDEKEEIKGRQDDVISDLEKGASGYRYGYTLREQLGNLARGMKSGAMDIGHVSKELARGSAEMLSEPGRVRRIARAARRTGTSPEFVHGALGAAVPSALGAMYLYGTDSGKLVRDRVGSEGTDAATGIKGAPIAKKKPEEWREQNPGRFAGLVGLGAALSGGVMAKFFSDITKVT